LGFDAEFADRQARVIQAFSSMGIRTTCTCTPYFVGNLPQHGDHVAWAESSAVSFANSVLGARSNREGGPSALAAAITGRTPRYGLHLQENRQAQLVVDVRCPVQSLADFGALGTMVGQIARNRIPFFGASDFEFGTHNDLLKALGAAMAASGAVALYHIEGITPEADQADIVAPDAEPVVIESLDEGYATLTSTRDHEVDLVWIGCPHASLQELAQVIELLADRRVRTALWVTMARELRAEAEKAGLVAELEGLGGQVVADTCLVVAPIRELGFRRMATPSGKGAYYAPSHSGLGVRYGSLETCIEAAVTGKWKD
jgi:predicted aconitase